MLQKKIHEGGQRQRWSRSPGQNGGLAKVVSGFDYAAMPEIKYGKIFDSNE
jgi:hypothetical protein